MHLKTTFEEILAVIKVPIIITLIPLAAPLVLGLFLKVDPYDTTLQITDDNRIVAPKDWYGVLGLGVAIMQWPWMIYIPVDDPRHACAVKLMKENRKFDMDSCPKPAK